MMATSMFKCNQSFYLVLLAVSITCCLTTLCGLCANINIIIYYYCWIAEYTTLDCVFISIYQPCSELIKATKAFVYFLAVWLLSI